MIPEYDDAVISLVGTVRATQDLPAAVTQHFGVNLTDFIPATSLEISNVVPPTPPKSGFFWDQQAVVSFSLSVESAYDPAIEKSATHSQVYIGDTYGYLISVTNNGAQPL